MKSKNNMTESEYFDQLTEQIRLAYVYLLKVHIKYCYRYQFLKSRIRDEELKKDFQQIDQFFYIESGKINWNTIRPLMPPKIEGKIKKEYGELNENEIRLCCLLLFNVACKDIAEILPYTQRSIHSLTHRIKQKTGMKNIKEDLKNIIFYEKPE